MSKSKEPSKKKVVVTTTTTPKTTVTPAASTRAKATTTPTYELVFGRTTYMWMAIGVGLIALGMILMSGGKMPSPDVWDDSIIYSFRRTVLAPMVILAGLGVEIYAIFKR